MERSTRCACRRPSRRRSSIAGNTNWTPGSGPSTASPRRSRRCSEDCLRRCTRRSTASGTTSSATTGSSATPRRGESICIGEASTASLSFAGVRPQPKDGLQVAALPCELVDRRSRPLSSPHAGARRLEEAIVDSRLQRPHRRHPCGAPSRSRSTSSACPTQSGERIEPGKPEQEGGPLSERISTLAGRVEHGLGAQQAAFVGLSVATRRGLRIDPGPQTDAARPRREGGSAPLGQHPETDSYRFMCMSWMEAMVPLPWQSRHCSFCALPATARRAS